MNSNGSRRHNRPLSSSKNPHFQNEARCTTFLVKMSFTCMRMKNHFHIKGWTLNLVLIQRLGGTRKWPIRWPRGFGALNAIPRSWIFTSVLVGPTYLLPPNRCSHCTEVWLRTCPICDAPLSRSARRSFASSQKQRRHNRSCVWTEAPSGMIFVAAQKLSGAAWIIIIIIIIIIIMFISYIA